MNTLIGDGHSPKNLINRGKELKLIEMAFDALLSQQSLLSTPIIDFFGIAGIGKTRVLREISAICHTKGLPCLELNEKQTQLDASQNTSRISHEILQQTKKYAQALPKRIGDSRIQTVEAIKVLLANKPVVILLDSIDTSNDALVNWIQMTLRDLMEHNNLFVVLTSKQKIVFENDWSIARKLTPFQLKPLNRDDSKLYLTSINDAISPEIRDFIFQWTRGYPSAMEVMAKAIIQHKFDITKREDQQQLISIIIEKVIDKKVLGHVEHSQLDWYKAHFLLLSMARRFNLVIMQELLETFGSPPIEKIESKLEYMGLPKRLNANTGLLYWDLQKAGFTIDESIRNLFLVYQRVHNFSLFVTINQHLAKRNLEIALELNGPDSVRFLREYLYHSAQSADGQTVEAILQPIEQQMSKISSDAKLQLYEEFPLDNELQEILGQHREIVYEFIKDHLTREE